MRRLSLLLALSIALALSAPASASAAGVLEYQLQYAPASSANRPLLIVTASLDPQAALPATIQVPVPADGVVLWAGEIMRIDQSADVERPTTVERVGDMDVYTLTLEQSYTAQIEVQVPEPTMSGTHLKGSVAWTNPGDEVLVIGGAVVEPGARNVKTNPKLAGKVQTNDIGESLYPLQSTRLASGDTYAIQVEWDKGAGAGTGAGQGVPPLLLIALGASVLTLIAVLVSQRTKARRRAQDEAREQARERRTGERSDEQ